MTKNRTRRSIIVLVVLILLTIAAALVACVVGQVHATPHDVTNTILMSWGVKSDGTTPRIVTSTLWEVRFPRLVIALAVGAGLGCAGALLQGIFANPLAEPSIIGVSSGGAVFASGLLAIASLAGVERSYGFLKWGTALAAFIGALLTTLLVYSLSRVQGKAVVVNLILVGVAINAMAGGFVTLFSFIGGTMAQSQVVFWQLGSLAGAGWSSAVITLIITVIGIVIACLCAPKMDLLALGENQARHLGVNVERFRLCVIILVAALVGVGVAFAGVIAFVGLIVPHAIRLIIGPQHKWLLPTSAFGGAFVLLVADTCARTIISTAELPIGMLTSLIGGPIFLLLLRRYKSVGTGWQ